MTEPAASERRQLRVEMLLPALEVGGMETMAAGLIRALAARGLDVGATCIERVGEIGEMLMAEGYRVTVVRAPGKWTNIHAPALIDWFGQLRPDVVHSHSGAWLKSARAARGAGVSRIIHTVHGLQDKERWYDLLSMRVARRYTDVIVPVSRALEDYLRTRVRARPEALRVVANGIDTARFCPGGRTGELARRLGLPPGAPLIGIVARLAPIKNFPLLLRAVAAVRGAGVDAHLAIVGDGPLRADIERLAAELGIAPAVHLLGAVNDAERMYREFDLFVLSSLAEGTSISMLEAMATGLPIVATDVGGNADLLDGGRCGLLVPSNDDVALSDAIRSLLGDAERRAMMGTAARCRAVEAYGMAPMADRYLALYRGGS